MFGCGAVIITVILCIVTITVVSRIIRGQRHPLLDEIEPVIAVTGCDSGFGFLLSIALEKLGYKVVSGCLTDEGVERLKNVVTSAVKCDVTNDTHVANFAQAADEVVKANPKRRFWGLVNNAGVGIPGPFEWLTVEEIRFSMDVNFLGAVRCCKSFLPLLKQTRGSRIINITSAAGLCTFRGGAGYNASKYASEALTEVLRLEFEQWGIFVSAVEPAFMRTNIIASTDKHLQKMFEKVPEEIKCHYSAADVEKYSKQVQAFVDRSAEDPALVVQLIAHILQSKSPKLRYLAGWAARTVIWALRYIFPVEVNLFLVKYAMPFIKAKQN